MSDGPLLSVIVPTYNRRESLRLTLEGLARQTLPLDCFEVLVVSDGCTDGTDEFLADWAGQTPYRLRPIAQANGGPARARNHGVAEAAGEVIVFLDDDVEPAPDFLSAHAAYHRGSDRRVVIGPMLPDPELRGRESPWIAWEHAMLEKQYAAWREGVWTGAGANHFYSGNASLRREHLLRAGGFDETFKRQEDVELAYRLERECGVTFHVELNAVGTHRPSRTFPSWLAVPYAYGQLDVVRAQRGDLSWEVVRHGFHARNQVTQALARLTLRCRPAAAPLRVLLLLVARVGYRVGVAGVSNGALSVIYNLHYLHGAQDRLGTPQEMCRLLHQGQPATLHAR